MINSTKVSLIVAMDESCGIGKNDRIPWHIRKDLIRLASMTRGKMTILGDRSYNSMAGYYDKSGRPMPAKEYLVLSFDKNFKSTRNNTSTVNSLDEAVKHIKESGEDEVFVLGGASVFKQMLSITDRLYLTIVNGKFDCDTFFPDYSDFKKVVSEETDSDEGFTFNHLTLER